MQIPYWHYFIAIEEELIIISKYIELTQDNFNVYSIELTKLFLSICSEIDVVSRVLCKDVDLALYEKERGDNNPNMNLFRKIIMKFFPRFYSTNITLPTNNLSFQPWLEFNNDANPNWWKQYNDVKHERSQYYKDANLKNVLFSMSGLLVLLVYLYGRKPQIELEYQNLPKLFRVEDDFTDGGIQWYSGHLSVPEGFIGKF
jgi:hypothetical protein